MAIRVVNQAEKNLTYIVMAGAQKRLIEITYKKISSGQIVTRVVEPYKFKLAPKKGSSGRFKWLFAFDPKDRTIKKFLYSNIQSVKLLDKKFSPRWPISL